MSMLTMSPSSITRASGIPWQTTSLTLEHRRLGEALVAQRRRVGAVVAEELVADPVELVGGDARGDVARRPARGPGRRVAQATRIFSIVSASLTSLPVNGAGAGRSTYSGRAMESGTGRRGEIAAGAIAVEVMRAV